MNRVLFFILLAASITVCAKAQTNAPVAVEGHINITSNEAQFDLKDRIAIYRGNVRVEGQGMSLACGVLTAKLPPAGNRIGSFIGKENVIIDLVDDKGQKIHGTGQQLVYTYSVSGTETNELVELSGNPVLTTAQGTMKSDVIILDRFNHKLMAITPKMLIRPETAGLTNLFSLPTNAVREPAPSP